MQSEGVSVALINVIEHRLSELLKGSSNWWVTLESLSSNLDDIAFMFQSYEVSESFALLEFVKIVLRKSFANELIEEVNKRIDQSEYSIPEPFKSMFEREIHRLSMEDFDVDLIPQLSKLSDRLTSVRHLLEASKTYGTAHEYHLLKLLIDSSKPVVRRLNEYVARFLEETLTALKENPSPSTFREKVRRFVKKAHEIAYGWPKE